MPQTRGQCARWAAALCSAILLVACSAPRLDLSSPARLDASLKRMRAALPKERQVEFDQAFELLGNAAADGGLDGMVGLRRLDGMTADEMIAEAAKVRAASAKAKSPMPPAKR